MSRSVWSITVFHAGLGKSRVITGSDKFIVEEKARAQRLQWDALWQRQQEREAHKQQVSLQRQNLQNQQRAHKDNAAREKQEATAYKQARLDDAEQLTQDAQKALLDVKSLLAHTLNVNDVVDWSSIKHTAPYAVPQPRRPTFDEPKLLELRSMPERGNAAFNVLLDDPEDLLELPPKPFFPFFTKRWKAQCQKVKSHNFGLLKANREQHVARMQAKFDDALTRWRQHAAEVEAENARRRAEHEHALQQAELDWHKATEGHAAAKAAYEQEQKNHNARIDMHRAAYEHCEPGAVHDYFDLVLSTSSYPEAFPREWNIEYLADSKMLVLDFRLPSPEDMPRLKEVRYIASRDEMKEVFLRDGEANELYDSALYQMALRTLHELFESDYANAIDAAVFNGIVHGVDKANGRSVTACVMSIQANKDEFLEIHLSNVDPKACFKKLKGVGSSQLHGLSPVAPIVQIDKSDSRFVDAYAVANTVDESTNLAAMDWKDFEHLVRELFEKEFSTTGGEVRITQASRDGGVDAVAFDPDPIRGGKIVIQAKRYTNVVGVSAVRDLYGTVMNEGATKGILVTTANFGTDSYEFAKGKPLTLLNGSNLLHLLAKHGHKATIDIQAARFEKTASQSH